MDHAFRYGIEHECALLRADGTFADFTDLGFDTVQGIVDSLPEDPADYPDLRVGDQGIKRKRWYVEGYERFDDDGRLLRCDPKGIEIRTRIHDSIDAAVAALEADQKLLDAAAAGCGLYPTAIGFNPVRSTYPIVPPLGEWERRYRLGSPEERTAHLHMVTYGPDLNLSLAGLEPGGMLGGPSMSADRSLAGPSVSADGSLAGPSVSADGSLAGASMSAAELVDIGRKLTYYSPWLVPLSFSSPFRDGEPWGGLSARTHVRTGPRPAVLVFLDPAAHAAAHVDADPSLTQPARLPAEVGRIEFKAFDACADATLYGELLSLLTGLVLDTTLPGRRTTPDAAAHQRVARTGLADPETYAGTGALLDAADAALSSRPADLIRLATLRGRWARHECPATTMLTRYANGHPVAGLRRP